MSSERWAAWLLKSKKIKDKYDDNHKLLVNELIKLSPGWFGKYNSYEVLVLLYFLNKNMQSQKLLYQRFLNGSKIFSTSIKDGRFKSIFEKINIQGEELLSSIENEEKVLTILSNEFAQIKDHIKLKDFEKGIFFTRINEHKLDIFTNKLFDLNLKLDSNIIKQVHKTMIYDGKKRNKLFGNIKSYLKKVYLNNEILLKDPVTHKQMATLIYISTYLAFFFNVIDYPSFSSVTTMAREIAIQ